uniref:Uncharacterized protein n=1 Tax=Arundo donax TaxID=35708 RepID=A0A0A9G1C4_ARUDO
MLATTMAGMHISESKQQQLFFVSDELGAFFFFSFFNFIQEASGGLQRDRIDPTCAACLISSLPPAWKHTYICMSQMDACMAAREDKINAIPLEFSTCASVPTLPSVSTRANVVYRFAGARATSSMGLHGS